MGQVLGIAYCTSHLVFEYEKWGKWGPFGNFLFLSNYREENFAVKEAEPLKVINLGRGAHLCPLKGLIFGLGVASASAKFLHKGPIV